MAMWRSLLPATARIAKGHLFSTRVARRTATCCVSATGQIGTARDAGTKRALGVRHTSGLAPPPAGPSSGVGDKATYVHPLSQIVLERLQSCHGRWLEEAGLATGLQLKKDGTFVLRFPRASSDIVAEGGGARDSEVPGEPAAERLADGDSIWTMYEATEKKHYLCVSKGGLVGQYLLQDNTKPAWHTEKRSTPERIQEAVDGMVEQIQDLGIQGGAK